MPFVISNNVKIIVLIVTYNPNIKAFKETLRCVVNTAEKVLIIDNASKNLSEINDLTSQFKNISIIKNEKNLGISKPYNTAISFARENNYDALLLLDQDSILCDNFVSEYRKHFSDQYVCLAPLIAHRSKEYMEFVGDYFAEQKGAPPCEVASTINSGTLINLKNLPSQIHIDESLFIDWIDTDFFLQVQKSGLKTLRINTATLLADIGDFKKHKMLNRVWFSSNYSPQRLLFQAKDTAYFFKKYYKEKNPFFKTHEYVTITLWRWLMMAIFEKKRLRKITSLIKGLAAGILGNV